ncbi:MAG: tripartite tricarboxylate transporter TctB family protein [Syntrophales bacterium]
MNPRKEIASSLALILFSMIFLLYTIRYPLDDWENPGPAVFPLILGGILLALASGQMIRALLASKQPGRAGEKGRGIGAVKKFLRENGGEAKVVILTAMLILYILLMQWLGFFVSTFLLVVFTSRLIEAREWGKPLALSVGVCLFCYLLFEVWIKLSFPRGILF